MEKLDQYWAIEWHESGAIFARRLNDSIRVALLARENGLPVRSVIIGVADNFANARKVVLETKRLIKNEGKKSPGDSATAHGSN
jgi:hypothetical protein